MNFFRKKKIVPLSSHIDAQSTVGEYTYIGEGCYVTKAIIGRYCSIGNYVIIGPGEHELSRVSTSAEVYPDDDWYELLTSKDITIGNDVWIGSGSIIRRGVKIGNGAVIGANSFVNSDVYPFSIVAGSPARYIRKRFSEEQIQRIENSHWWDYDKDVAIEMVKELEQYIN